MFNYLAYDYDSDLMKPEKVYSLMITPKDGELVKKLPALFPMNLCSKPYYLSSEYQA